MAKHNKQKRSEAIESRILVDTTLKLARALDIEKLVVQADGLSDIRSVDSLRESEQVIWLTRNRESLPLDERTNDFQIRLPRTALTRMSQLKIGLMLAVMNEYVGIDESVLCLSGVAGSERLDTLLIANPRRDFPWFGRRKAGEIRNVVATRELARIIDIALRLAAEGREGRPIGTIFVLGEIDQLGPYLRQLVLNPCEGHPQRKRNIHDLDFFETIREFAALDGAFIVDKKGVVHSAGTYLHPPPKKFKLRSGLGARHAAGLSITTVTEAVATVVSSSSGTITIFHEGEVILELERVQSGQ
jgi:DNA integrity scanning protein DisA with diadenylate cyclase activity